MSHVVYDHHHHQQTHPHTHTHLPTHTNRQDRLQYTAPQLARSVITTTRRCGNQNQSLIHIVDPDYDTNDSGKFTCALLVETTINLEDSIEIYQRRFQIPRR